MTQAMQLTLDLDAIASPDPSKLFNDPAVQSIIGGGYSAVLDVLGTIEHVEMEISRAILRYQTREDALKAMGCSSMQVISQMRYTAWWEGKYPLDHVLFCAFMSCRSPVFQSPMPESLYEVHVRQYLRQIAAGLDPDRPTPTELSVMVSLGSLHTVPPKFEVSRLFHSNRETMLEGYGDAFKNDGYLTDGFQPYANKMDSLWWQEGADVMRKFYRHNSVSRLTNFKTRSEILRRSCKEREGRMIDYRDWAERNRE